MKVSSKIYSGFLLLMLLAVIVIGNQWQAIHQMQTVNKELSEINVKSAETVLTLQRVAWVLGQDSTKYLALLHPEYLTIVEEDRTEFLQYFDDLSKTATSVPEQ